jgi:hypothetical protein
MINSINLNGEVLAVQLQELGQPIIGDDSSSMVEETAVATPDAENVAE